MLDHEHFETLCALAVTGQLAGGELLEFTSHCESCALCRLHTVQLAQVSSLLLGGRAPNATRVQVPVKMYDRFILRGQREAIPLTRPPGTRLSPKSVTGAVTAALASLFLFFPVSRRGLGTHLPDQPNSPFKQRAVADHPTFRTAPVTTTVHSRGPVKVRLGQPRPKELQHPAIGGIQPFGMSPATLRSSAPVHDLRFYVPATRVPAYPGFGNYPVPRLAASGQGSSQVVGLFANRTTEPVFRLNPQLVHLAYVSQSPDLLIVPPPFTFEIHTTQ